MLFARQVDSLSQFLDRRQAIVERIERDLLNVRDKEVSRIRDYQYFDQRLASCFFAAPGLARDWMHANRALAAAHVADGFEPVQLDGYSGEFDPLQLILLAYRHWERARWPGQSGRLSYAQTIYGAFVIRQLERLSLRIWDERDDRAPARLGDLQGLLARLNDDRSPVVLVRDIHWLMQTAQGPLTRQLLPYFTVAEQVAATLGGSSRLEFHRAGAKLAGGHLRSQLRYRMWDTDRTIDDPEVLAITRNSNAMDSALLVGDLVSLLEAYDTACSAPDEGGRPELADAILQGLSADPELLLVRLDLLGPCTMLEELFAASGESGPAQFTHRGETHVKLLDRYRGQIGRLAPSLLADASRLDPTARLYSPYGLTYGFAADLLTDMAIATLVAQPSFGLSFEETFESQGRLEEKLTRTRGWTALPRRSEERPHGDHSGEWAQRIFARLVEALEARASRPTAENASDRRAAKLFVVPESRPVGSPEPVLPSGLVPAQDHCYTTQVARAASTGATLWARPQMANDRTEGRFLASAEVDGEWFAVSKVILSLLTSQGTDVLITDVPAQVVDVLRLTSPGLLGMVLVVGSDAGQTGSDAEPQRSDPV